MKATMTSMSARTSLAGVQGVAFVPSMARNGRVVPTTATKSGATNLVKTRTITSDINALLMTSVPVEKSLLHKLEVETTDNSIDRPIIVGHRGALYQELENTLEGFEICAKMGCDAVELDVFALKCGTVVVFHGGGTDENPGDLLDYCGVKGGILDLTYGEVKQLKFNTDFEEFVCPKTKIENGSIPTLSEVLVNAKSTGLHVKIELKGPNSVEPTLELVDRLGMVNQCSFSTFDLNRLALVRKLRPQSENDQHVYKTGALFDEIPNDFIDMAKTAGADEIHLRYDTCTSKIISQVHAAGFGSMAWFRGPIGMASDTLEKYWDVGNEDEAMYTTLIRTGVQQLCLNKPDVMLSLQKKRAA